jgi:HK97 family phage major capsid protein
MGPPSQVGAVTVWGIPVVESEAIDENTGVIGDWSMGASLFDREQAAIRVGTINDQMIRNMQTILAELRAAFVVWRPAMFTKITGI